MSVFIFVLIVTIYGIGLHKSKKIKDIHILWMVPLSVNLFWQLGNYLYLGYLDPFWVIAVPVGLFISFVITGLILILLDTREKRDRSS